MRLRGARPFRIVADRAGRLASDEPLPGSRTALTTALLFCCAAALRTARRSARWPANVWRIYLLRSRHFACGWRTKCRWGSDHRRVTASSASDAWATFTRAFCSTACGSTRRRSTSYAEHAEDCCQICLQTAYCHYFTWSASDKVCWLKQWAGTAAVTPGAVSGHFSRRAACGCETASNASCARPRSRCAGASAAECCSSCVGLAGCGG